MLEFQRNYKSATGFIKYFLFKDKYFPLGLASGFTVWARFECGPEIS